MVLLNEIIPNGFSGLTASRDIVYFHADDAFAKGCQSHLNGNLSQASAFYRQVTQSSTTKYISYGNLAAIEFARCNYSKCLQLLLLSHQDSEPNYGSHLISSLSFRLGYYVEGFRYFEYRWLNSFIPRINQYLLVSDYFNPCEPSDTLLVQEGGLGDIVFASRLKHIFNSTFPTFFLCDSKCCSLMKVLEPSVQSISTTNLAYTSALFKSWIPIQSFMRVADYPFSRVNTSYSPSFSTNFFPQGQPLDIGLFWQGNEVTELFMIPGSRSIPLQCFAPLFRVDNFRLHSLQVGSGTEQISDNANLKFHFCIHHYPELVSNFESLAAYLKDLDAVITTDSFIANFAGWLGIKCMVIVSKYCDWRWVHRSKNHFSYWYPSVKILEWQSQLNSIYLNKCILEFLHANL
tara:strand:+ start:3299 stop:4510 length:1212 start_codon:yes stop_codon:yes gene_type:complete